MVTGRVSFRSKVEASSSGQEIQMLDRSRLSGTRLLLSLVLVCSILLPLMVPMVSSQATVTVTNVQASTSAYVTVGYSTSQRNVTVTQPMSYRLEPYGYDVPSGSFSLTQTKESNAGGGEFEGPSACAYYDYFLFNAIKGHEIRGHFDAYNLPPYAMAAAPVNFYILNSQQFDSFRFTATCNYIVGWTYMLATYAYSYDLDWVVPASGEYAFVFLSTNLPYYGTITLTAKDLNTITQITAFTYTSSMLYTLQNTQLMISTQLNVNPQLTRNEYYPYALALAAVIIIIALVTVITLKRRIKKKPTK